LEDIEVTDFPETNLVVVMSSDKGLCGGVNSILSRMTRQMLARMEAEGKQYKLVILGEKGRGQLRRQFEDKIVSCVTDRAVPYHFDLSCAVATELLNSEFEAVHLLYNEFKSAIAYTPSIKTIVPLLDEADDWLNDYQVEPEGDIDVIQNFFEYTLATQIHHSLLENATSEQSSRMNAMENASKNASEMINKLELQYNRARQARITTELIEIISGASALKD
jgi:F-type H+-transporting ATPase subunit gamma